MSVAAVGRPVRRQVVLLQRPARPALRPARGGRRLAGLRRRGAHRAAGDPRLRRSWTWSSPSTSRWRWSRSGSPTSHPTAGPPGSATACCNLTHRDGHERPRAAGPGRALPGDAWRSTPWPRRSRPGTGCGWRSRRRTGRWRGRAPEPVTADRVPRGRARWCCRCGPTPAPPRLPVPIARRAGGRAADRPPRQLEPGRQRWTVTRDLVDYDLGAGGGQGPRRGALRRHRPGADPPRRRALQLGRPTTSARSAARAPGPWASPATTGRSRRITRTVLTSTPHGVPAARPARRLRRTERVFADSWRLTIPRDHV